MPGTSARGIGSGHGENGDKLTARWLLAALLLVAASNAGRAEVRLDRNQERVTLKAVDLNPQLVAYLSRPAGEELVRVSAFLERYLQQ